MLSYVVVQLKIIQFFFIVRSLFENVAIYIYISRMQYIYSLVLLVRSKSQRNKRNERAEWKKANDETAQLEFCHFTINEYNNVF